MLHLVRRKLIVFFCVHYNHSIVSQFNILMSKYKTNEYVWKCINELKCTYTYRLSVSH